MRQPVVLLILLVCVGLSVVRPVAAQTGGWSQPVEVSLPSGVLAAGQTTPTPPPNAGTPVVYGSSWFPDLAVGPQGSVHIVWYSGVAFGVDSSIDLLMYRELQNGAWSEINNIAAPGEAGTTVRASIAMSRDGRLHVLVRGQDGIQHFSAPWDSALSVRAWSPLRVLSGAAVYYDALAIDSKGTIHGLWNELVPDDPQKPNKECPSCSDLFYRRSVDGGNIWSEPLNLSRMPDGSVKPQIKIDQHDGIHVVWDEGFDTYIGKGKPKIGVYRHSTDGGAHWSEPVKFELPGDGAHQTTLAVTAEGNPLVVYRGVNTNKVFFRYSTDGGKEWSKAAEIPGVLARSSDETPYDSYSMAVDGDGLIHLVMSGYIASPDLDVKLKNPSLVHLTWDGATWSAPEPIMSNDLYPEWPRIAVADGNRLHVVWFTRSGQDLYRSEKAHYRVWYSSKSIDAPLATALPLFTPVPTVAPTLTPSPAPPTPRPTIAPAALAAPVVDGPPEWEGRGLVTVALALLPVLGLLLILGCATWLLRRRHRQAPRGRRG